MYGIDLLGTDIESYNLKFQAYLCGHDDECQRFGSKQALQTAKENIEHHYQVVGTLEEPLKTCELLEDDMPQFFQGCADLMVETWKG